MEGFSLTRQKKDQMLDFIEGNPVLLKVKMLGHRNEKEKEIGDERVELKGRTADTLNVDTAL